MTMECIDRIQFWIKFKSNIKYKRVLDFRDIEQFTMYEFMPGNILNWDKLFLL